MNIKKTNQKKKSKNENIYNIVLKLLLELKINDLICEERLNNFTTYFILYIIFLMNDIMKHII